MSMKGLLEVRKSILLYSIILFTILSFVYFSIAIVLEVNTNKVKKVTITENEERLVATERNIISNKIDGITSDLLFVSDNLTFSNSDSKDIKYDANNLKAFSDRKKIYDQIRYIDINGNEKIRINYSKNGSNLVNKEDLQNKKDRYYFKETIGLNKNQVYISKLDLNMENGKIENPIKPIIRLSTPVFSKEGKLEGIVILNYYAKYLLEDFSDIASTSLGNLFLVNSNGYWIFNNKNKEKEWSFMYEDKKDVSFKNEFPNEWNNINKSEEGTIITPNGLYSYINIISDIGSSSDKIDYSKNLIVADDSNWVAMSFIAKDNKNGQIFFTNLYQNIFFMLSSQKLIIFLILAVSLGLAFLMGINKISQERIKYFSEFDTMTGVFNRRAGFELLNEKYRNIMKARGNASVCFIDINGLKQVNDNFGHETGDELILSVVNSMKKNTRQSDFIIRLGGDEFLIIFVNIEQEEIEAIWSKIIGEYEKINEIENRKYIISVSHGIEEFKFNFNEYIEQIIDSADEKMYKEKKILKNNLIIIRKI